MKILVIGGTRFIGMYAVQALLSEGHQVTLFNRSGPKLFEGKVDWVKGDRNNAETLSAAIQKSAPDVVLDMIPFVESHAEILLDAAADIVSRVVMISSMDVYRGYGKLLGIEPDSDTPEVTPFAEDAPTRSVLFPYRGPEPRAEDDPSRMMDDYDKIPIENRIMNHPAISGTVLRLPIVYGPGDGQHRMFEFLKRMLDHREIIPINENYAHWRTSRGYAADIGHGIAAAVTQEKASGEVFNVCSETALSTLEWVQLIAKAVGWKGKIVLTGPESTPPHLNIQMNTAQNLVSDSRKIRDLLGYTEQVSQAQGILRTVEWEVENHPPIPPEQLAKMFDYDAEDALI